MGKDVQAIGNRRRYRLAGGECSVSNKVGLSPTNGTQKNRIAAINPKIPLGSSGGNCA